MACPGAVSVSASKAVLGFSKSIVVDTSETAALPALVKNAYRTGGASIPIVIFTDPGMTQIYGSYNHPQMKSQNYGEIFADTKDKIRDSIKEGTFALGGAAPKIAKAEGSKVEEWTSSKGTPINAKLLGIEDDKIFLFATEGGKTIRATADQLSKESVEKAKGMVKAAE
ncbi:MAG: hypothetical protein ACSHYF_07485 [Verrucomicrobiaceae bacterium]